MSESMFHYRYGDPYPQIPRLQGNLGAVITIGNFDGMHLGHQMIVAETVRLAKTMALPSLAITFDPHPSAVVGKMDVTQHRQLSLPQWRAERILAMGIDAVLCLDFTRELSMLTAEQFCRQLLYEWLNVRLLCIGADFHLGYKRQGDEKVLRAIGKELGFALTFLSPKLMDGVKVSSSLIRSFIASGRLDEATAFLGRPYEIEGIVVEGSARGRELGFKTANLAVVPQLLLPVRGVYITHVQHKNRLHQAVSNIGFRPTFEASLATQVEAHLLDFKDDLYGQKIILQFLKRLRDEQKFKDAVQLQKAIRHDIAEARAFFKSY